MLNKMLYGEQYAIILKGQLIKASFIKEKMTIFGKRYLFSVQTVNDWGEGAQLFLIRRSNILHKTN